MYKHFLDKAFGFHERVTATIDGGWNARQKTLVDYGRCYALLTSDSKNSWNLYHIIATVRETRELALDQVMLPRRTQVCVSLSVCLSGAWALRVGLSL